jgi:prepilin-type N-terminal cleavage/methylation domain-containing protein
MEQRNGFTLLETLLATAILSGALVATSALFSFSIETNLSNQQRTVATLFLHEKIDEFQSAPLSDPRWTPGGSLNPSALASGYFDTDPSGAYVRFWLVSPGIPRTVTVVVAARQGGLSHRYMELMRGTTAQATRF